MAKTNREKLLERYRRHYQGNSLIHAGLQDDDVGIRRAAAKEMQRTHCEPSTISLALADPDHLVRFHSLHSSHSYTEEHIQTGTHDSYAEVQSYFFHKLILQLSKAQISLALSSTHTAVKASVISRDDVTLNSDQIETIFKGRSNALKALLVQNPNTTLTPNQITYCLMHKDYEITESILRRTDIIPTPHQVSKILLSGRSGDISFLVTRDNIHISEVQIDKLLADHLSYQAKPYVSRTISPSTICALIGRQSFLPTASQNFQLQCISENDWVIRNVYESRLEEWASIRERNSLMNSFSKTTQQASIKAL